MHSTVAHIVLIVIIQRTLTHYGCNNRYLSLLYEFLKFIIGMGNVDSSTHKYHWSLGSLKNLVCFLKLTNMNTIIRLISTNIYIRWVFCIARSHLYILRQINKYRTWLTCWGNLKCHLNSSAK